MLTAIYFTSKKIQNFSQKEIDQTSNLCYNKNIT